MERRPLPRTGAVFTDLRGEDRSLRVSWHHESQLIVLSLWRDNLCAGSFRLVADEVPDLIELLRVGLDQDHNTARERVERADHLPSRAS